MLAIADAIDQILERGCAFVILLKMREGAEALACIAKIGVLLGEAEAEEVFAVGCAGAEEG